MAHFRGTVSGGRGEASRLGTAKSGLLVEANGWGGGVSVRLFVKDGQDWAHVQLTGGSGGAGGRVTLHHGPVGPGARAALAAAMQSHAA